VIAHGLPRPLNLPNRQRDGSSVREAGAIPAPSVFCMETCDWALPDKSRFFPSGKRSKSKPRRIWPRSSRLHARRNDRLRAR